MAYTYTRIDPSDPNLSALAEKYRELRLSALKESPTSFSSTYETEVAFTKDQWISRLRTPGKETFICTTSPQIIAADCEWVAQVTLLGPIAAQTFRLPESSGQPAVANDDEEEKWQMLSLYTLPSHRGRGVGKDLCREAFRYLTSLERLPKKVRVRIMVKPQNTVTLKMYGGLGFFDAGLCTLEEALRANGDSEFIPAGPLTEKYTSRSGIIMALELKRA